MSWTGLQFFKPDEFVCRCPNQCPQKDAVEYMDHSLLILLDFLRMRLHHPVIVSSGLRCEDWNEHVGGAPTSYHIRGQAADIYSPSVSLDRVYLHCERLKFSGIFRYPTHIHVDVGRGYQRGMQVDDKMIYLLSQRTVANI